jgi:phosphoglycolate phosphatase
VRYDLLIFDLDGTLADSFQLFFQDMQELIEHFNLRPIDEATLEQLRNSGAREIMKLLGIPAWKIPLVTRFARNLAAAKASQVHLFPGIPAMLEHLERLGCELAMVSSNSEANVRAILGENSKRIRHYACGASLFGKAAKFRRVLKRTGIPADRVLTIGDELRDLEAAREVGIAFGAVSWGYTRPAAFHPHSPAFLFESPDEIAPVLELPRVE